MTVVGARSGASGASGGSGAGGASWRSAFDIARAVHSGEVSARQVVESSLERIVERDPAIGAFLWQAGEDAMAHAQALDRKRSAGGRLGRLAGVPVGLKDNLNWRTHPVTCGSRILEGYVAPYSATVVERLLAEDAVILGKTNLDEFAMGSSCENSALRVTRNPWRLDRVPGGSSGGSAAAVAAGMVPLALGSDTGGSIRQPAALCGLVGLKPTYGRVSRYGLVAFASSLDQIGPLARTTRDAALALEVIAGHDPRDSTSATLAAPAVLASLAEGVRGLRLGIVREAGVDQLPIDVRRAWEGALAVLRDAGARLTEVSIPNLPASIAIYYVVANCEASANLARFDGIRYGRRAAARDLASVYVESRSEGFGPEVKRRIMLGTFALSAGYADQYYERARGVLAALRRQVDAALAEVDVLVTPTSPSAAFALGERVDDPLAMYQSDVFTVPANLVGAPAVAVPMGFADDGLPLSFQAMGRAWDEATILRVAQTLETTLELDLEAPWPAR